MRRLIGEYWMTVTRLNHWTKEREKETWLKQIRGINLNVQGD
jgi:hypothetical protein